MPKRHLSCGFCWTRAISSIGLVAVFLATGALHAFDPSSIAHYGLPDWSGYLLACVEILSAIAFLLGVAFVQWIFLGISIAATGFHIRFGEESLLVLPAIPIALLLTLRWASRPQAACSCALRHHSVSEKS